MKIIKKLLLFVVMFLITFLNFGNTLLINGKEDIDITTTSVRDDLKSMNEDKLSYLSESDFIFIAMSQYYDNNDLLRTYIYVNIPYTFLQTDVKYYANISTSVMDKNYNINEDFELYELNYINNEKTWYKLEVLNLPNLEETTRRYFINDMRAYSETNSYSFEDGSNIGGGGGNEDTPNNDTSIPNDDYLFYDEVSKVYIFNGISNNTIKVFREEIETITITEKEVVSICYGDDLDFFGLETGLLKSGNVYNDAFFIFFNTDKKIDELKEIELTYQRFDFCIGNHGTTAQMETAFTETFVNEWLNGDRKGYTGSSYDEDFYINYHEQKVDTIEPGTTKVSASKVNFWGKEIFKYEKLDNIMDLKKYKATDESAFVFTDYADKYSWGVHFLDTTRQFTQKGSNGVAGLITASSVCNTAILRLKYATNGVVYNAYAVDVPTDDVTGGSANTDINSNYEEWFEKILMLIGVLILIVILGYFTPVLKVVFNFIIKVITAPFKLIGKLFKTKKRKR